MKLNFLSRFGLPILAGAVALTSLVGCDTSVRVGYGRAYDHVWYGDPYCRNSWDYGCNYGYNDGARIGIVFGRRHPGWHWRRGWGVVASEASRPTTWENEFNLSPRTVKFLKSAFNNALDGKTQQLHAIGISYDDINGLAQFRMPSEQSIAAAAHELHLKRADLRDFVQVFMIRMKAAVASVN
jgi:hypothetical protein